MVLARSSPSSKANNFCHRALLSATVRFAARTLVSHGAFDVLASHWRIGNSRGKDIRGSETPWLTVGDMTWHSSWRRNVAIVSHCRIVRCRWMWPCLFPQILRDVVHRIFVANDRDDSLKQCRHTQKIQRYPKTTCSCFRRAVIDMKNENVKELQLRHITVVSQLEPWLRCNISVPPALLYRGMPHDAAHQPRWAKRHGKSSNRKRNPEELCQNPTRSYDSAHEFKKHGMAVAPRGIGPSLALHRLPSPAVAKLSCRSLCWAHQGSWNIWNQWHFFMWPFFKAYKAS